MTMWTRAWAGVVRQKSKSLILFAVMFILGNVMAGAIAVEQSVKQTEQGIKGRLGAEATFELDYPTLWADGEKDPDLFETIEDVSLETIQKIGESPYVSYYDYNIGRYISSEKWSEYDPKKRDKSQEGGETAIYLTGVNVGALLAIKEQRIELVEGRTLTDEEVAQGKKLAVMSKEFAEANNLHVGDKLALDNIFYEYAQGGERSPEPSFTQELPVEIIGLFSPLIVKQESTGQKSDLDYSRDYQAIRQYNTVYLPNRVVLDFNLAFFQNLAKISGMEMTEEEVTRESQMYTPMYVLKSPEMASDFKAEAQPLLPKYYEVLTASDQYEAIAGSLNGLKQMADTSLAVAIGTTVFVLTLVILLFLRDRKHEMGIYLSLGEKPWKIVGQMVIEVLLVAVVAVSLAVVSGNLLAKTFSDSLVSMATPPKVTSMESGIPEFIASSSISEEDVASAYQIQLSAKYVGLFYVVGLGTVLLATILPTVYLLRLNPKKILM